jgi:hypothetical protein
LLAEKALAAGEAPVREQHRLEVFLSQRLERKGLACGLGQSLDIAAKRVGERDQGKGGGDGRHGMLSKSGVVTLTHHWHCRVLNGGPMAERFERHRQPWRQDEIQKLHTLAKKGMPLRGIAKALTRSEESVKERAKLDGLGIAKLH